MQLAALDRDERLALVALVEWVLASDNRTTDDEIGALHRVIDALGPERWQVLADEVAARFPDDAALRAFLPGIGRQEARELIVATVLDLALTDGIDLRESELLEWLRSVWHVDVTFGDDGGSAG